MYVYLIKSSKALKIGVSDNPQTRLTGLQTSNPERLELIYTIQCQNRDDALRLESILHRRYQQDLLNGEWFNLDPDAVISDLEFCISVSPLLYREQNSIEEYIEKFKAIDKVMADKYVATPSDIERIYKEFTISRIQQRMFMQEIANMIAWLLIASMVVSFVLSYGVALFANDPVWFIGAISIAFFNLISISILAYIKRKIKAI